MQYTQQTARRADAEQPTCESWGRSTHCRNVQIVDHVTLSAIWHETQRDRNIPSLDGDRFGAQFGFHGIEVAEAIADGFLNVALGAGGFRSQVLPEQSVVQVPAAVELDGALQGDDTRHVPRRQGGVELFQRGVDVVHVRCVVFGMVQRHSFRRYGRF